MQVGADLRIEAESVHPKCWRVLLNGQDISGACRSVDLYLHREDATYARIEIDVRRVELNAMALAVLQAHVDRQGTPPVRLPLLQEGEVDSPLPPPEQL